MRVYDDLQDSVIQRMVQEGGVLEGHSGPSAGAFWTLCRRNFHSQELVKMAIQMSQQGTSIQLPITKSRLTARSPPDFGSSKSGRVRDAQHQPGVLSMSNRALPAGSAPGGA